MTLPLALATFVCTPVAIYDADGPIWCKEGPRIRVAAASGREMDGACIKGHPCPAMNPVEARARVIQVMRGKVTGKLPTGHLTITAPPMRCTAHGRSGDRVVASCTLSWGADLGCASIATGAVADWPEWRRRYGLGSCR